ncbi:MAG: type 2 isopentenyl-diphosphate Delta-isomerase [SAR324 cluster bacterium]|nr:type 2 isopentenyl-diphosphate Delta-isomerase [SAR324 cluster bacterium]
MKQPKQRAPAVEQDSLNRRKKDHIAACLDDGVDLGRDSFAAYKLRYNALPDLALQEISTAVEFAGKTIAAPIVISCMTGGVGEEFQRINRNLALGAQALNIPLGLGSLTVLLSHDAAAASFQVRELAPDVPLIANLGLVSFNYGLRHEDIGRIIEEVRPDLLGLHLNALQEAIQEGGDSDFRGLLKHLEAIAARCPLPIYVKECGGGIAPEIVARLAAAGAAYVDVSGSDGTSWAAVEGRLSDDPSLGELFRDFGLPTAWILERLTPELQGGARIVASGGIRDGIQVAKALALGADYCALARPFLIAATESADAVLALGRRLIAELRTAMFLVGAGQVDQLERALFMNDH